MTAPIWLWVDLHRSRNWPWLHNVSTSDSLAKGEDYRISNATYYQWKSKYAGVSANELKRIKDLEAENGKFKRMYAELALENTAIRDVLSRKL